ncbi:hypothetical protein ACFQE1_03290 [Halobium palmae]|uniref:Uncharacterized protein n=1 Tax=Halobium palmae TaxID=1776492 RepID=A0ABD5RVT2_9EURY
MTTTDHDVAGTGDPPILLLTPTGGIRGGESCVATAHPSADGDTETVTVTYRAIDDWFEDQPAQFPSYGVILVGEHARSTQGQLDDDVSVEDGVPVVTTIADATNTAELGIVLDLYLDEWNPDEGSLVVCFESLTQLLETVSHQRAYRLMHLLVTRATSVGAHVHVHVHCDPTVLEPETLRTFSQLFETVIEPDIDAQASHPSLSLEEGLNVLHSSRRRSIIRVLSELEGSVWIEALVAQLEEDSNAESATTERVHDRLQAALVHTSPEARRMRRRRGRSGEPRCPSRVELLRRFGVSRRTRDHSGRTRSVSDAQ